MSNPPQEAAQKTHTHPFRLDSMGLFVSAVCLVHCAALPLVAIALPAAAFLVDPELHHRFHWFMLALAIPASLAALIVGGMRHGKWQWLPLGAVGLGLMTFAVVANEAAGDVAGEAILTILGAAIAAIAHALNWRQLLRHART